MRSITAQQRRDDDRPKDDTPGRKDLNDEPFRPNTGIPGRRSHDEDDSRPTRIPDDVDKIRRK
jgi:hypothetical protein